MEVAPTLGAGRIRPSLACSACWMVVQAALLFAGCCCAFQVQPPVFAAPHSRTASGVPNTNMNANRLCELPWRLPGASVRTARPSSWASPSPSRNGAGLTAAVESYGDALGGDGDGGEGFAADKRYRRKPRGNSLIRDSAGLPVEKIYAPRQSAYGKPVVGGTGRTKKARPQGEKREVSINNAARLKVAGGVAKGRRLESPDVFLRPMMAKVKEALFSTLTGFGVFETGDARFLDLFSGSGSVGIEALSRGAGHATFVDFAKDCCEVSLRNGHICGFVGKTKAVRGDVMDVLYNPRKYGLDTPFDVVTATPPYEEVVYADLVKALAVSDLVAQDTIVVLEYPVELGCMPHAIGDGTMVGLRNRRYGRTVVGVWVYLPSGQFGDMLDSRPEEFISIRKK